MGIVNLFIVYSPLHYICTEHIVEHFEKNQDNYLFYIKKPFAKMVSNTLCREAVFLPWPRFYPEKGICGRIQRTLKNLRIVESYCNGYDTIQIHTPVIDTEAINYFINHLTNSFPNAKVTVRLIPDGVLNIQRHPLGTIKEFLQYFRKLRRLVSPKLNYYPLFGDRTGSDSTIVDRIYLLPGFPHEYNQKKVVQMPPFYQMDEGKSGSRELRALVIGQPLLRDRRLTDKQRMEISRGIAIFLKEQGMDRIDYKSHPREAEREFLCEHYREIHPEEPLETFLVHNHYDVVIGIYSTALLTARLILPGKCRVISFGFDQIFYKDSDSKTKVMSVFDRLGVEMIDSAGASSTFITN